MILVPRESPFHALFIVVNACDILIFARYRYRRRIKHKDHHAVDKGQKDYIQDDTHYISIQDVQHRHILARDITIFVLVAVLQEFVLQYKAQFNKM